MQEIKQISKFSRIVIKKATQKRKKKKMQNLDKYLDPDLDLDSKSSFS